MLGQLVVAGKAHRHGVPYLTAVYIAFASKRLGLRYALGYGLVEQESNFQHVYGHDSGGLFPGHRVTHANYREFREHLIRTSGGGANGVGLTQITYFPYIRGAPGLWRRRTNVRFGLGLVAGLVGTKGEREGLAEYNGGPSNPSYGYADEVLSRASRWRGLIG